MHVNTAKIISKMSKMYRHFSDVKNDPGECPDRRDRLRRHLMELSLHMRCNNTVAAKFKRYESVIIQETRKITT